MALSLLSALGKRARPTYRRTSNGALNSPDRLSDLPYNDAPSIERLVFICGLHRSGTTLLERMLASQFDVACLRAHVPESEGQHLQSVYSAANAFGGAGLFAFSQDMQNELEALLTDPAACQRRILADWRRFVVGDSATLLEKSPPNLTKIGWLRTVFPGARFVIISRDPRAACAATQKWSGTSLNDLMHHWERAYSKAISEFRDEDCTIIRYEDLCASPGDQLARVANFLDLPKRNQPCALDKRHSALSNSNAQYIKMHGDTRYGPGVWNRFGYEV